MPDEITCLAGGWSAEPYLDRLAGYVIGVNDAGLLAPCDAIVSMDRVWAEHRWGQLVERAGPTWLRKAPPDRPPWLTVFACDHESTIFSDQPGRLNGTHSGFCALNLAYQMRPRRLALVGFDMGKGPNGEAHWFEDYPWAPAGATSGGKFKAWAGQFHTAARMFRSIGCEVRVLGKTAIPAFGPAT